MSHTELDADKTAKITPPTPTFQALQSLVGILWRPRVTLSYLHAQGHRTWWLPATLTVLFLVLPLALQAPFLAQQAREAVLESQRQAEERFGQSLSDEQIQQMTAVTASPLITFVFPAISSVVALIVGWLVRAGALYLAGLLLGGRSTFGAMLSMTIWTWVPYTVRGIFRTIYIPLAGQPVINEGLSGFVQGTGLGSIIIRALLGQIDIFLVWHLVLLTIGVMTVTRLPCRKALLLTLGVWATLTLLGLLPALVGGLFAQMSGAL